MLSYEVAIGVKELSKLISDGLARYVLVINCSSTLFQKVVDLDGDEGEVVLRGGDLREAVDISVYLLAAQELKGFFSENFHQEYAGQKFDIPKNSVMACAAPTVYYVEREVFKNVSSIFDFNEQDLPIGQWRIKLDQDRVQLYFSPEQLEIISNALNTKTNQSILLNSIFFGAVMEMLNQLKQADDYDHYRWANIIEAKCASLQFALDSTEIVIAAQRLLMSPLTQLNERVFAIGEE